MYDSQFKIARILIHCVQPYSTAWAESWSDTSSARHPEKTLLLESSQRIIETLSCDLILRGETLQSIKTVIWSKEEEYATLSKPLASFYILAPRQFTSITGANTLRRLNCCHTLKNQLNYTTEDTREILPWQCTSKYYTVLSRLRRAGRSLRHLHPHIWNCEKPKVVCRIPWMPRIDKCHVEIS